MKAFQKIKDLFFNLYLLPVRNNVRLALSLKNRIMLNTLHLHATAFPIKNLVRNAFSGNIVIDVGCYNGSTPVFFHRNLSGVKVIGFEAAKRSYQAALGSTAGIPEIKIENYAVSDSCGIAEFFVTDNEVSSSLNKLTGNDPRFHTQEVEKVNTVTLDEYFSNHGLARERVLLLKLDVQGHELKVLKGAKNTLCNTLFVLTEMSNHDSYEGGSKYYEVDQLLRHNGFAVHNLFSPYSHGRSLYEYDALYVNNSLLKN